MDPIFVTDSLKSVKWWLDDLLSLVFALQIRGTRNATERISFVPVGGARNLPAWRRLGKMKEQYLE
jgi:hypothetical protein